MVSWAGGEGEEGRRGWGEKEGEEMNEEGEGCSEGEREVSGDGSQGKLYLKSTFLLYP